MVLKMNTIIKFRIPGKIIAYKNPNITTKANSKYSRCPYKIRTYSDHKMKEYEQYIGLIAKNHMQLYNIKPLECAIILKIDAFFKIPTIFSKNQKDLILKGKIKYTNYPDLTNILKLVEDSIKNICFGDDCQTTKAIVSKNWCQNLESDSYIDIEIRKDIDD